MKLIGNPSPGSKIKIYWTELQSDDYDIGYLYQTPKMDMDDFMVHVPYPINPGGKDSCDPVWISLRKLLKNNRVKQIRILKP